MSANMLALGGLLGIANAGTRIEFGVYAGASLALIVRHEGDTIGVDSFEGMAEPGPRDLVGEVSEYPRGRLRLPLHLVKVPGATLIKGWVPAVLEQLPQGPFAVAHVDMDHYAPTLAALEWLRPRMMRGGIIACDDWFEGRTLLAAGAINDVAERYPLTGTEGRVAWWVLP